MYSHMPDRLLAREDHSINIDSSMFFISADLGQAQDYTCITIIERLTKGVGVLDEVHYHLRHIERPPRGTEYPNIVDRIEAIFNSETLKEFKKAVVIDMTGVGRPIFDLMVQQGFRRVLNAITITGGNEVTEPHWNTHNVPKRDLVTNLQIMLQNGALRIARGLKEADALTDELMNFKTKITDSGRDVYGARAGTHDDIVLSVAMGAWMATRRRCRSGFYLEW